MADSKEKQVFINQILFWSNPNMSETSKYTMKRKGSSVVIYENGTTEVLSLNNRNTPIAEIQDEKGNLSIVELDVTKTYVFGIKNVSNAKAPVVLVNFQESKNTPAVRKSTTPSTGSGCSKVMSSYKRNGLFD